MAGLEKLLRHSRKLGIRSQKEGLLAIKTRQQNKQLQLDSNEGVEEPSHRM